MWGISRLYDMLGVGADAPAGADEAAAETDGGTQQVVLDGETPVSLDVRAGSASGSDADVDADVDTAALEAALNDALGGGPTSATAGSSPSVGRLRAAAGSDSTVTPVVAADDPEFGEDPFGRPWGSYMADDTIRNLAENTITYTPAVADWMLAHDDLVPGVMSRFKALLLGGEGLGVDPADPHNDADQRLADHLEAIYHGGDTVDTQVTPGDVIEHALASNIQHARSVLRATDLQPVDLDTLEYVQDGATGESIYVQEATQYTTFEVGDDGTVSTETEETDDDRALRVGEDVFEARLYRTPPLRAVANDVVNKLQLKRLKARKAEIASIGGLFITVQPPPWLSESEYNDVVPADEHQFGDAALTKLELSMRSDLSDALDTLQQYQTATVMSVPSHWEVGTIDLPEMDSSFDDMIRGYNDAISRRLLLPLDLLELESGSELSRNSMIELLFSMVAGWQRELAGVFDAFGAVQADIHDMNGSVEHRLPAPTPEDEKQIVSLLNYAGLLGLSEAETRQLANTLEGVDLDDSPDDGPEGGMEDLPPAGGPDDPADREAAMKDRLRQGASQDGSQQGGGGAQAEARSPFQFDPEGPESGGGGGGALGVRVPEPPTTADDRVRNLWKELINRAVAAAHEANVHARAAFEADWNPVLHPRGPDGRFIKRPFSVPDEIAGLGVDDLVHELVTADPDFHKNLRDVDGQIDGVDVEGIVKDVGRRTDAPGAGVDWGSENPADTPRPLTQATLPSDPADWDSLRGEKIRLPESVNSSHPASDTVYSGVYTVSDASPGEGDIPPTITLTRAGGVQYLRPGDLPGGGGGDDAEIGPDEGGDPAPLPAVADAADAATQALADPDDELDLPESVPQLPGGRIQTSVVDDPPDNPTLAQSLALITQSYLLGRDRGPGMGYRPEDGHGWTDVVNEWAANGYEAQTTEPAWDAAADVIERDVEIPDLELPPARDTPVSYPGDTVDAMRDSIGFSQAYAAKNLADEDGMLTVYRGLSGEQADEARAAMDAGPDGIFEADPRALESYSLSKDAAKRWGDVVIERKIPVKDVGYYGPAILPEMAKTEEITVLGREPYTVSGENIDTRSEPWPGTNV